MRSRAPVIPVMMFLVSTAACTPAATTDSPETRLEKARALARLEIEGGALEETLDLGASLAADATMDALVLELGREPTADERQRAKAVMRTSLSEFVTAEALEDAAAQVYAGLFTAAELEQALAFYASPTGRKILELQGRIDAELGAAVEGVVETHLDTFIASVDAGLERAIPELAEDESS